MLSFNKMFKLIFLLSVTVIDVRLVNGDNIQAKNVILLLFDDLGRTDLSLFGAEWDTPNLDSFFRNSLMLSHHYIGYYCSASRSQFLTGRYSWYQGYGTLNTFGHIGAIPSSVPNVAEYLSKYANYNTYAIGKWQLGSAKYDQLAYNRGFDYFLGFNRGSPDYITKDSIGPNNKYYIDFFENLEVNRDYIGSYSTDDYFNKLIDIIDDDNDYDAHAEQSPFFMYVALQANHVPLAESTGYYDECLRKYPHLKENMKIRDRIGICESTIAVDYQFGRLMKLFESSDKLKEIYENTIIIVTSDNGGNIGEGSCNYPLRGGKGTFFDGNQKVLTAVGGGALPNKQRGVILDGLISNVDWFPTLLAFADLIDKDSSYVSFNHELLVSENNDNIIETSLELDGFNMYNYIMGIDDTSVRDHIMLHLAPSLDSNENLIKSIENYELNDFEQIAMIFYDNNGNLWKYFDMSGNTGIIGGKRVHSAWCVPLLPKTGQAEQTSLSQNSYKQSMRSRQSYTYKLDESVNSANNDYYINVALFDLTNDKREELNILDNDHSNEIPSELRSIIDEKIAFYTNANLNRNSRTLYGSVGCLNAQTHMIMADCSHTAMQHNAWVPFYDHDEWLNALLSTCGFDDTHPIYLLLTTEKQLPTTLFNNEVMTVFGKEEIQKYHQRAPKYDQLPKRYYESTDSLDQAMVHAHVHARSDVVELLRASNVKTDGVVGATSRTRARRGDTLVHQMGELYGMYANMQGLVILLVFGLSIVCGLCCGKLCYVLSDFVVSLREKQRRDADEYSALI